MPGGVKAGAGLGEVSVEQATRLFELMVRSRSLEDKLHALYKQGFLKGRLISGRGQEAISVGATSAIEPDEVVCPVHRDLGAHLAKGTTVLSVLLHYLGRAEGLSGGRDGDIHMGEWQRRVFPMVSHLPDSWPIAIGIAYASKHRGRPRATLAFCGDGASSTGLWHESLNFASVFQTPNVFVIENNQYAYSTPTERQYRVTQLSGRAGGYSMPADVVDGNDVLAVHAATNRAVARARAGEGPTLIEAMTMRMDGHAVHDGADYVPPELLTEWRQRDPIERLALRLVKVGLDSARLDSIRTKAREEVEHAVAEAQAAAMPDPGTQQLGVFAGT